MISGLRNSGQNPAVLTSTIDASVESQFTDFAAGRSRLNQNDL
ncbi:MAG: hypothetical protein O2911_09040 [Bacteroidetes bacterium]|nr:hypothetical protein [Bacteroidota bacterium]